MFMGWVQWTLWIAGAIAFIMWLYRAYQNVDATDPGRRRYGHGWAIGSWFVPILNLWRPKQIVNDVWRAGQNPGDPGFLLIAWWLLWLANGFVASSARRVYNNAGTPEEWQTGIVRYLVADGTGAVAALLAVLVAIKLTRNLNAARSRPGRLLVPRQQQGSPDGRAERDDDDAERHADGQVTDDVLDQHLHADEDQQRAEPVVQVLEALRHPVEQEVQGAEPEQREGVRGEDQNVSA